MMYLSKNNSPLTFGFQRGTDSSFLDESPVLVLLCVSPDILLCCQKQTTATRGLHLTKKRQYGLWYCLFWWGQAALDIFELSFFTKNLHQATKKDFLFFRYIFNFHLFTIFFNKVPCRVHSWWEADAGMFASPQSSGLYLNFTRWTALCHNSPSLVQASGEEAAVGPDCRLLSLNLNFLSTWDCRAADVNICHLIHLKEFNSRSSPVLGLGYRLTFNGPRFSARGRRLRLIFSGFGVTLIGELSFRREMLQVIINDYKRVTPVSGSAPGSAPHPCLSHTHS